MIQRLFAPISRPEAPPPWGLAAAFSSLIAAFAAILIGSTLALMFYCGAPENAAYCQALNFRLPPAVSLAAWTLGAALTIVFVFATRRWPAERAALRLGPMRASVFWVLLISVGLAVTLDVITLRITSPLVAEPELQSFKALPAGPLDWALALVFMVIAQPAAEELVFRGLLLPALRQAAGPWPGYLLSAVLYAVFHLLAYPPAAQDLNGLWYGALLPLVGGLVFGALRLHTGSTRAAILGHAAFGLFAVLKLAALG